MCDESIYFACLKYRWMNHWKTTSQVVLGDMGPVARAIIAPLFIKPGVKKQLQLQGMGRHSDDEIDTIAIKDWQAIVDVLGDKVRRERARKKQRVEQHSP